MEGFTNTRARIKKLSFDQPGKMSLYLADGRIIIVPVSRFPGIKKLSLAQRQKWQILQGGDEGDGFTFRDSDEVYHLEQILGLPEHYNHIPPNQEMLSN